MVFESPNRLYEASGEPAINSADAGTFFFSPAEGAPDHDDCAGGGPKVVDPADHNGGTGAVETEAPPPTPPIAIAIVIGGGEGLGSRLVLS